MFGQLRGRSVFNTPTCFTHFRPIFGLLFEKRRKCRPTVGHHALHRYGAMTPSTSSPPLSDAEQLFFSVAGEPSGASSPGTEAGSPSALRFPPTTGELALAFGGGVEKPWNEPALNTNFGWPGGAFFGG